MALLVFKILVALIAVLVSAIVAAVVALTLSGALRLKLGTRLARYLSQPIPNYQPFSTYEIPLLEKVMQPGDILLVDGNTRISTAIKYLTQSTWSHAAFYAGPATNKFTESGEAAPLIEALLDEGVIASPLSKYRNFNIRICRPVGLSDADRETAVDFMVRSLGLQYDLKHIFDLLRYLCATPPVPVRFRRQLIALGSGEPSRAICSSLIAESFQSIHYPILPLIEKITKVSSYHYSVKEIYHIRHHSLFTPRDFDVSPFFKIIKPTIEHGFDYRSLTFMDPR
ncbi:YiiX/YebB-like N1pC/P60 family cysteine hydrolase [Candidatus Spongiihabitans sp.]|uniref:YiiX/YebB-like N1pC/P60 family cysteine hydrolase n=1 Tax=Candidatus Spongiihabitans sp. TaxID=3101308 RepID=UPI003C79DFAA